MKQSVETKEKKSTQEVSLVVQNMHLMAEISRNITPDQWKVIRSSIAPTLNDDELRVFLYQSHKLGLDPLNKEIFAYASGAGSSRKLVVIVARDGKRMVAERTGKLKLLKSEAIYRKKTEKGFERCQPWEGGELWGAVATLQKHGSEEEYSVTLPISEYRLNSPIWSSKPETMIKKVAESQVLSQAFPILSGVYDEAERWDETPKSNDIKDFKQSKKEETIIDGDETDKMNEEITEGLEKEQEATKPVEASETKETTEDAPKETEKMATVGQITLLGQWMKNGKIKEADLKGKDLKSLTLEEASKLISSVK